MIELRRTPVTASSPQVTEEAALTETEKRFLQPVKNTETFFKWLAKQDEEIAKYWQDRVSLINGKWLQTNLEILNNISLEQSFTFGKVTQIGVFRFQDKKMPSPVEEALACCYVEGGQKFYRIYHDLEEPSEADIYDESFNKCRSRFKFNDDRDRLPYNFFDSYYSILKKCLKVRKRAGC